MSSENQVEPLKIVTSDENQNVGFPCVGGNYGKIVNNQTLQSFNKIAECGNFEPGYTRQIKAVVKEIFDITQTKENELQDEYKRLANKDDDGKPKIINRNENGRVYPVYDFSPENKETADQVYKNLQDGDLLLKHRPKLYYSKLGPAKLSAVDLIQLEWLIDENK